MNPNAGHRGGSSSDRAHRRRQRPRRDAVFIKLRPKRSKHCYGIGIGVMTIARNPSEASYSVKIPPERL